MSDSWPHGLYSPWNSPGQNTGVGSPSLLQGIFPTQGSNPGLLHCRRILYQLSHKENPRILQWVMYPFSSRSSWPRNWTKVSCISDRFFTNWAIREAKAVPKLVYGRDGLFLTNPQRFTTTVFITNLPRFRYDSRGCTRISFVFKDWKKWLKTNSSTSLFSK